jgi:hypothetical protein
MTFCLSAIFAFPPEMLQRAFVTFGTSAMKKSFSSAKEGLASGSKLKQRTSWA